MAFVAKNIRGKGRKVSFTLKDGEFESTSTITTSIRFFSKISSLQGVAGEDEAPEVQFQKVLDLLEFILGSEALDSILLHLESYETLEAEAEALGKVTEIIFEKVLPKVQSQAEKA